MSQEAVSGPAAGGRPAPDGGEDAAAQALDRAAEIDRLSNLLGVYVETLTTPSGMDPGHAGGCG
ncbi:hypothetical protein RKE29_04755 [Streptomyces sp. B1866]|uniref:hypothetical protein n=1 Tax=Streptomyces sp. B1866 TaxID=3075431 RepID=UPI00288D11CA|nr:hypothetical protein [Streptomyces sp. B1866]MDT3395957.1 hypothetical protein [Streptomyces sp. B1866]